jgi:hypothetical protein
MVARPDRPSESAALEGITRSLARYVVATRFDELPAAVRREAQRSLLNWIGVAVGSIRPDRTARYHACGPHQRVLARTCSTSTIRT